MKQKKLTYYSNSIKVSLTIFWWCQLQICKITKQFEEVFRLKQLHKLTKCQW
jgi:hypothetical protein